MFLDWKTQYPSNDYTTQGNLKIQQIPIKLPMEFFTELEWKFFFNLYENTKDPEYPKQSWERKMELEESDSQSQTRLQSYCHPNSMVLIQKQKYRSMKQGRNKPTHLRSVNLRQNWQEYTMEKIQSLL